MSGINDFVVKFATVNGSGSASANAMFAKTLFRMGIPVAPKNIFPSNIQGLPTWYEVRVSEKGYLGRRDGIDLMVAMNPQSYNDDVAEVVPGGWLFYDSSMPRIWGRDDITVLGGCRDPPCDIGLEVVEVPDGHLWLGFVKVRVNVRARSDVSLRLSRGCA